VFTQKMALANTTTSP